MRLSTALVGGLFLSSASAFQHVKLSNNNNARAFTRGPLAASMYLDLNENVDRDIAGMDQWTYDVGVERVGGVQIDSQDGNDFNLYTTEPIAAGNFLIKVPAEVTFSSAQVKQELDVQAAVDYLVRLGAGDQASDFYLFVKLLAEYEKGNDSPWFPWLNAMPRLFYNSVSMTNFCYECLPPLVFALSRKEKVKFDNFKEALTKTDAVSTGSDELMKWAYNVVTTRGFPTPSGDKVISPLADYFNHGTDTEIDLQFDDEGNCYAVATSDIEAGSQLRMSYGCPTNPSQLFATYGFLDRSSPATFCKMMNYQPTPELIDIGLDNSRMLFYHDTGDISDEVWDVVLYDVLKVDRAAQESFYNAHMAGDFDTKQAFHQQYIGETSTVIKKHVDTFLETLETLSARTVGQDLNIHPRIPVILEHNQFVKETFLNVKAKLDPIVAQSAGNYAEAFAPR